MRNITDERLHQMLSDFYQAEPGRIPSFHPCEESAPCPAVPFETIKNRKMIMIAASIVFVCILSISAFFLFGNINQIPVKDPSDTTGSISDSTIAEIATVSNHPSETTDATAQTQPTREAVSIDDSGNVIATDNTEIIAEEIVPTENHRDKPDENKSTLPSESQTPSEEFPTESEETSMIEMPECASGYSCDAQFSLELLSGSENVYCRITDENGALIGDTDLFSDQHIAYKSPQTDGTVFVSYNLYDLVDSGVNLPEGIYHFYFYGDKGMVVYHGKIQFTMD